MPSDASVKRVHAAYITALGPATTIQVGDLPTPEPGPTDLLIAVDLVAANPVDTSIRSGRYPTPTPFPFIVGRDLVGTVAAAGAGTEFAVGERVWCNSLGHGGRQGSFAEYAVAPADRCYRLPAGVDPAMAVAVAHPAATAYLAWFVHARLHAGETAYIGGAAGNLGSAATVLARRAGARVIASAQPPDHASCRAAGADVVLDYRDPHLADALRASAPAGVDVFWDTSGHHDLGLVAAAVAPGARVLLTAAALDRPALPVADLYTRDVSLHGFVISRARPTDLATAAALINDLLERGLLTARITETLPLSATADVHSRLESGQVEGRLLLDPSAG